jgi:hypothetical protein
MAASNRARRSMIGAAVASIAALLAAVVPHAGASAHPTRTDARAAATTTDPVPAAHINTMAQRGGEHGIQVGSAFYPEPPGKHWAQMLVLNRQTLAPVSPTTTFDCPYPYGDAKRFGCVTEVRRKVSGLTDGDLVIVSNQPDGTPPYTLEFALEHLGIGNDTAFRNSRDVRAGDFSSISVVGEKVAHWHAVIPGEGTPPAAGRMNDWLFREQDRKYVFAPSGRIPFETSAPASSSTENIIEIGHERFRAASGSGNDQQGFQVVVADPQTLKGTNHFFRTHATGDAGIGALEAMERTLAAANSAPGHPRLVFVTSLGNPSVNWYHGADANAKLNETISHVVDQLETLGGTRNGAYRALDPGLASHPQSYTLIGAGRRGHARGDEAVGERSGHRLNSRPMSGMLARTGTGYTFEVQDAPSIGGETEGADPAVGARALTRIAFQLPSDWPEHGNPGRTAAIAWIGQQLLGTPDFRGQYWTKATDRNGQFDFTFFTQLAADVGKLAYAPGVAFTEADLSWAKGELQQEISWLESVHRYISALSAPFSKTQLENWASLQKIANTIRDKVEISGDQKIHMQGKAWFDGFRSALAAIPVFHIGHAAHAIDTIYETVMRLIEINSEPAEEDFQGRADEVGELLAKRLTAAQTTLDRQLPDTIAADYGKLKVAGACSSLNPHDWSACPFDHSDWQFTKEDQALAAEALVSATQIWAYGELVPARYRAYRLPHWWRRKVSDNQEFNGETAFRRWHPFERLPDSAEMAVPILRNLPDYAHRIERADALHLKSTGDTWQIWALGFLTGDGTIGSPWVMNSPPASLMKHLFDAPPGGLGADREAFFIRNFKPSTLDHYPERDTPTGWCYNYAPSLCR